MKRVVRAIIAWARMFISWVDEWAADVPEDEPLTKTQVQCYLDTVLMARVEKWRRHRLENPQYWTYG